MLRRGGGVVSMLWSRRRLGEITLEPLPLLLRTLLMIFFMNFLPREKFWREKFSCRRDPNFGSARVRVISKSLPEPNIDGTLELTPAEEHRERVNKGLGENTLPIVNNQDM